MLSQKLVTRYNELKRQAPDCILLMQVGVFMQVMNEDAQIVSDLTGLKLQIAGEVGAEPVILGGPISRGKIIRNPIFNFIVFFNIITR
ncbi:MAG: hypothetical protein ABFS56_33360 [Pseudomonadota bacterium]